MYNIILFILNYVIDLLTFNGPSGGHIYYDHVRDIKKRK